VSLCLLLSIFPKCSCYSLSYSARPITTSLAVNQFVATKYERYTKIISIGFFLALDVYRSKFSATSPYIVGTYRDNEKFLWVSAGMWAVRTLSTFLFPLAFTSDSVRGNLKSPHTSDAAQSPPSKHAKEGNTLRLWLLPGVVPQLFLRGYCMGCYLRNDWECCWYVVCCMSFVHAPPPLGLRCSFSAPFLHFRFSS
jgi:hypothetical protein